MRITDIKLNETEIAYSTSESLERELEKNTNGDIYLFTVTFTLMLTYAALASASSIMSSTNIANRVMLGFAGVLTMVLAIISAIGFVSAIRVKFTSIVGVMPFLIVGNIFYQVYLVLLTALEKDKVTFITLMNSFQVYSYGKIIPLAFISKS